MNNFQERLNKLNEEQRRAVEAIEGPVMVIAGPGSGKTELLSLRVANILSKTDAGPGNILCLTFTESGAFNMRKRLIGLIGNEAYKVGIYTFHSFGTEIIGRYADKFYNGAVFSPADDVTQIEILEDVFKSLDYRNPLASKHEEQFTYLYKTKKAIENLKKAGISPAEFKKILEKNKKEIEFSDKLIGEVFNDRVSKKMFPGIYELIKNIQNKNTGEYNNVLVNSLSVALQKSEEDKSTTYITEWKKDWTVKGDDKKTHLEDFVNLEKMNALAQIYEDYLGSMKKNNYYDYNDMILDTITMLQNNIGVKLDLQERYQYILVDEFQDTNDAQMKILHLLTDNDVNEGRPNIMVVGDDDQAIYRFQGAEISNIFDFKKKYKDVNLIALKKNYRSTQEILNVALGVIKKGKNRLENVITDLKKELIAENNKKDDSGILGLEFINREAEYFWIAEEVERLIKSGTTKNEIAIIAREHKDLEQLVLHFHNKKIPVSYEREQNVLNEPHIVQLVTMARFANSIMRKEEEADDLLPEILSYPFWGIDRVNIWDISIKARAEHKPWLAIMREMGGKFSEIANFFIDLSGKINYKTAEEILHELIGSTDLVLPDEDNDDPPSTYSSGEARAIFNTGFKSYYFGESVFKEKRADYLKFLSSLQSFFGSLREYHRGKPLKVKDMLEFFDLHIKNNIPINNISAFSNSNEAVQLLTAHKAKGLEFEAVFVINCQEDVWNSGRSSRDIPMPMNLSINPAGDTQDDKLRLFYTAITRTKKKLYLTYYKKDSRGKDSVKLEFLHPEIGEKSLIEEKEISVNDFKESAEQLAINNWSVNFAKPIVENEKALLDKMLEKYQLSVTHFQNFLNVADAGPLAFLEKNLLMFPEPKTPSGAYGSAIHGTIQFIYHYLKNKESLPDIEEILLRFERLLINERLNEKDFNLMLGRGKKSLAVFYENKKSDFLSQDKIEFNFKNQGVVLGEAHLTGKIDKMRLINFEIVVTDFKTGKNIEDWEPKDKYDKIKAWKYRNQLIFYKLLVENSQDFGGKYFMNKGIIEFIEPEKGKIIDLELKIENKEVERMRKLIEVIYKRIKNLDFPDISEFSKDINGIKAFEESLLK